MCVTEVPLFETTYTLTGLVQLELRDEHGALKQYAETKNLVVTAGKGVVANRMQATPTLNAMTHVSVGTSTQAVSSADTDLIASVARVALTSTTVTANSIVYVATVAAGTATTTINEAGIHNASSGAQMLARTSGFTPIVKGGSDTLTITWTITVS